MGLSNFENNFSLLPGALDHALIAATRTRHLLGWRASRVEEFSIAVLQ
jgi:hypothetical protein